MIYEYTTLWNHFLDVAQEVRMDRTALVCHTVIWDMDTDSIVSAVVTLYRHPTDMEDRFTVTLHVRPHSDAGWSIPMATDVSINDAWCIGMVGNVSMRGF